MGDDEVLVVARVSDDGQSLGATWEVEVERRLHGGVAAGSGARLSDDEEGVVGSELVVEGLVGRPPAIEGVEVQRGGAEVVERQRVDEHLLDGGGVEGDVVVDELAEVRVAGGDVFVVTLGVSVGPLHRAAELLQGLGGGVSGWSEGKRRPNLPVGTYWPNGVPSPLHSKKP